MKLVILSVALFIGLAAGQCSYPCGIHECGLRPPGYGYGCPFGYVKNYCGCVESCQCDRCPKVDGNLYCEFGRKYDRRGCPKNECACDPNGSCPAIIWDCGLVPPGYEIVCPRGYEKDSCGCQISCQCAGCQKLTNFNLFCLRGRKTDRSGCPLDECNQFVISPPSGRP